MAEQHGRHPSHTKKRCSGECGLNLPLAAFGVNKQTKDGLHYSCKLCINLKQRKYNKDNPEVAREAKRRYIKNTRLKNLARNMNVDLTPA